jgi:putative colanic acid biosynthesis acetyltransferase WcaF
MVSDPETLDFGEGGAALDVGANRRARKWTRREQIGRCLWALCHPLFACSPRPLWGWRRTLLRLFGARIGAHVHVHPDVRIPIPWRLDIGDWSAVGSGATLYALGAITIRRGVTISQGAHLCAGTHDYTDPALPLLKPPITIHDEAWVCADAFIGPGIVVGRRAIVGARAVVMKDVAAGVIVAGNPARPIGTRHIRAGGNGTICDRSDASANPNQP